MTVPQLRIAFISHTDTWDASLAICKCSYTNIAEDAKARMPVNKDRIAYLVSAFIASWVEYSWIADASEICGTLTSQVNVDSPHLTDVYFEIEGLRLVRHRKEC